MAAEVILKFVDEAGRPIPQEVDPDKRDKRRKKWKKLLEWIGIGLGAWEIIVTLGGTGGPGGGGFRIKRITINEVQTNRTEI